MSKAPPKTPQDPEAEYMTLRISPENKPELLEALHVAAALNDAEGAGVSKPEARMAEAHRRIIIEWLLENRFQYRRALAEGAAGSAGAVQQMDALARDAYRCKKCRHTRVSAGGVITAVVVTWDMIAPAHLGADEISVFPTGRNCKENMVTLCRVCAADWAGLPAARRIAAAPLMLRAIGPTIEREAYEGWIARVMALLVQPEACQNASPQSSASQPSRPSTTDAHQTPPRSVAGSR